MQIVSLGDTLHEMSKPIFWEKIRKNSLNLQSAMDKKKYLFRHTI